MPQMQAPDRTGEKRELHIAQFERSDFPAVIVGQSYWLNVTTRAGKEIRTERAPVISLREALDGTSYLALTDENVDYRFMAPRDNTVVGIDATEDGDKLSPKALITLAKDEFNAFLATQREATVTADVDLDALPA